MFPRRGCARQVINVSPSPSQKCFPVGVAPRRGNICEHVSPSGWQKVSLLGNVSPSGWQEVQLLENVSPSGWQKVPFLGNVHNPDGETFVVCADHPLTCFPVELVQMFPRRGDGNKCFPVGAVRKCFPVELAGNVSPSPAAPTGKHWRPPRRGNILVYPGRCRPDGETFLCRFARFAPKCFPVGAINKKCFPVGGSAPTGKHFGPLCFPVGVVNAIHQMFPRRGRGPKCFPVEQMFPRRGGADKLDGETCSNVSPSGPNFWPRRGNICCICFPVELMFPR